jgi:hypothetical protein
MRRWAGVLAVIALALSWPVIAQQDEEIRISAENVEAERKAFVEKKLQLTEAESKAFWPIYDEYRKAMHEVDDKRLNLIRKFATEYQSLTDEKALEILDDYFGFREAKVKLQKSYVARFDSVLPAKKVTRYYQIENLIDTLIDHDLTRAIPLVE